METRQQSLKHVVVIEFSNGRIIFGYDFRVIREVAVDQAHEEQEELLGPDPWLYGLGEINKKALETLIQYSQEQGLLGRKMSLEELFINMEGHS